MSETQRNIGNPDAAQAIADAATEAKEEREQELSEAEQRKQDVLDALQTETVTSRIGGAPLRFTIFMGDEEDRLKELRRKEEDEGGLSATEEDEAEAWVREKLYEHCETEWPDRDFFEQLPTSVAMDTVGDVVAGGEEGETAGN